MCNRRDSVSCVAVLGLDVLLLYLFLYVTELRGNKYDQNYGEGISGISII